jgi:hypothetical protein
MSKPPRTSGPQFRADDAQQDAVRTTIVGGRPPGSGQRLGEVPRGVEVLVKKAAVDPDFRSTLLDGRAEAADAIGLELDAAEKLMLQAVPSEQLEAIIDRTTVPKQHRRVFLGTAASAMLAALVGGTGCRDAGDAVRGTRPDDFPAPTGSAPDMPPEPEPAPPSQGSGSEDSAAGESSGDEGSADPPQDQPGDQVIRGVRPDRPPPVTGIAPDMPPEGAPP